MKQHLLDYHTFILRFWQEQDDEKKGGEWRFTLLDPTTGHRYGFSNLNDLMDFINSQMIQK